MEKITICDEEGMAIVEVIIGDDSYRFRELCGEHYVRLSFSLPEYVEIPILSYIEVAGTKYTLLDPADITMRHSRNYEYRLMFEAPEGALKLYRLRNTVDGRLKFPLTARPKEHLQLIVDSLNSRESGWSVGECIDAPEKLISYNFSSCYDGLMLILQEFDTEVEIVGKVLNLRKVEYNKLDTLELGYGRLQGLQGGLSRTKFDNNRPLARLYAQGGSQNMDFSKYGSSELLLPKSSSIHYDGAHFEDEEGFLSLAAITYLTDAGGRYVYALNDISGNIADGSLDCTEVYPSRVGEVSEVVTTERADGDFDYDIIDASIPDTLDFNDYMIAGTDMSIVFQSGMLAGKEFSVKYHHNATSLYSGRRFAIVAQDIDGLRMPGEDFVPKAGDTYIVLNVSLPDAYIADNTTKSGASWDMFRKAVRYMHENRKQKYNFSGKLDAIYARDNWATISPKIVLGGYADINYDQSSFEGTMRIVSIQESLTNPYDIKLSFGQKPTPQGLSGTLRQINSNEAKVQLSQVSLTRSIARKVASIGSIGSSGSTTAAVTENYTIHTLIQPASGEEVYDMVPKTVIEGITEAQLAKLKDSSKYRLVLMHWRKHEGKSSKWTIPMLPFVDGRNTIISSFAEHNTWWPVDSYTTDWFRQSGDCLGDAIDISTVESGSAGWRFKRTHNRKRYIGVALFKYVEGAAGAGWVRVSNISGVRLFCQAGGEVRLSQEPL